MKPFYLDVLNQLDLPRSLAEFDPVVIGTPPLGIATDSSDIDIACSASDFDRFARVANRAFGSMHSFSIRTTDHLPEPAIIASFFACEWEIEVFCQQIATAHQWGVRHFRIEEKLLALRPELRERIVELKQGGMKTEPVFARVLDLVGDPYEALLRLEGQSDDRLLALL
ncbi:MAG: DUF4269 domain-containing protein [Roseibium sp.]|uniref:DUF4269 domain-containing protein n=1 Tax=Roseibium sp. TaxID=1936156 RepID=UPI003D9C18DA